MNTVQQGVQLNTCMRTATLEGVLLEDSTLLDYGAHTCLVSCSAVEALKERGLVLAIRPAKGARTCYP